jgi:hypothetical protein
MDVRMKMAGGIAGAVLSLAFSGAALAQQVPGQVGSGAPEDVFLEVTLAPDGAITLSQSDFNLAWGGYYRFNLVCPEGLADGAGIGFYAPELLENSHVRILSVADTKNPELDLQVNFYLQGRNFGKIECEGLAATPRFSFHPMRRGTYPFTIVNESVDPFREVMGQFIVE